MELGRGAIFRRRANGRYLRAEVCVNLNRPTVDVSLLCCTRAEPTVILRNRGGRNDVESRIVQQILSLAVVLEGDVSGEGRRHGQANVRRLCCACTRCESAESCYHDARRHLTRHKISDREPPEA
jgi:hypothetical protein